MRSRIQGSEEAATAPSKVNQATRLFSSGLLRMGAEGFASSRKVTFMWRWEETYSPRFSWPETGRISTEKR